MTNDMFLIFLIDKLAYNCLYKKVAKLTLLWFVFCCMATNGFGANAPVLANKVLIVRYTILNKEENTRALALKLFVENEWTKNKEHRSETICRK